MLIYILKRIIMIIPVLIGLSLLLFVISRLLPGDPVGLAAGPRATLEQIEALRVEFGLDKSLPVQYFNYIAGLLSGDWGASLITRRPVLDDLRIYLPATLELVVFSMTLSVIIGVPLGILSAVRPGGRLDVVVRIASLASLSMPRFFLGLMLQLFFAMLLAWFPLGGRFPFIVFPPPNVTGFMTIDSLVAGDIQAFGLSLKHLALPSIAMALSPMATILQLTRASTIETLNQDYVKTARAMGLSQRLILFKYVLKNSLSATLTMTALFVGWALSGTVLVETIFDWPGIGLYATHSVISQDFMPILGVSIVIGLIFIIINLIADLLYGMLNPKVQYK
jgi:peptide/nickel transport system permease protein